MKKSVPKIYNSPRALVLKFFRFLSLKIVGVFINQIISKVSLQRQALKIVGIFINQIILKVSLERQE